MRVFETPDDLARAAAERFAQLARVAIAARNVFIVALSGGSTPKRLHAYLAGEFREEIDWSRVIVVFGDERYVPPTDEQSNERMARETLLDHVSVSEDNILGMYHPGGPEVAADRYEGMLRAQFGEGFATDLTLLGIGPDGHTASLFPGRPSVHETERWVIAAKANAGVEDRITMTVPILNRSRETLFLVAGEDKREALERALNGPENWDETPSQAVGRHAQNVEWYVDRTAAG